MIFREYDLRIIKKYKNRKLYDSVSRKFIKLKDVFDMFIEGEKIKILNHRGEDITNDVISKAKFNNSMYIPIDKNYFKKVINSFEKLLQGNYDEFAEVLFKLVDEKFIDGKYAHTLAIKIINRLGEKHDVSESEIIEFLKDCGLVPTEKYDNLKNENKKLKNELNFQTGKKEIVDSFWKYVKNDKFNELNKILSENVCINFSNNEKILSPANEFAELGKKHFKKWKTEVEKNYPCEKKVISIVKMSEDNSTSFYVTFVFGFSNSLISSIEEYSENSEWKN